MGFAIKGKESSFNGYTKGVMTTLFDNLGVTVQQVSEEAGKRGTSWNSLVKNDLKSYYANHRHEFLSSVASPPPSPDYAPYSDQTHCCLY